MLFVKEWISFFVVDGCLNSIQEVWSGGAVVLGKHPVPGRPIVWIIVGQGPIALAVGAGGVWWDIFTLLYLISPLSPSLWETARYSLKYCFTGPLKKKNKKKQKTKTQQPTSHRAYEKWRRINVDAT